MDEKWTLKPTQDKVWGSGYFTSARNYQSDQGGCACDLKHRQSIQS